jgi:hypothetical protein
MVTAREDLPEDIDALERISAVMNQGFTRDCGFAIL